MIGITPIMDFCRDHYGTTYAPNTRETFRRQTMHQFLQAGLVVANPNDPERAVNSPKWCYQVEPSALRLLRSYGSEGWASHLEKWRASIESLAARYSRKRALNRVPVQIAEISWETEVWVAESETHLIHFNGDRFLGPRS